jgi:hypothetical protein
VSDRPRPPGDAELSRALARLDRPDRVRTQVAGHLLFRRPPGADRLLSELAPLARRTRQPSLFARRWPIGPGSAPRPG